MTSALKRQIATYAQSAMEPIPNAGEFGDLISLGLQLVDAVAGSIRRWQARIKAGELTYLTADAQGYMDGYASLHQAFRNLEEQGIDGGSSVSLEDRARFTDARNELATLLQISVEQIERAREQFRRGEGRPLKEVRDELRRRVGA